MTAAETAAGVTGRRRGRTIWVQGLACGALLTFAAPTLLMLVVVLAPTGLCLLAEPRSGRGQARAVALGCAATALGPVWRLWMAGDRLDQALTILTEPATLCMAWGAGATAWAMCQITPVAIRVLWDAKEAAKSRALKAELETLRSTWNLDQSL